MRRVLRHLQEGEDKQIIRTIERVVKQNLRQRQREHSVGHPAPALDVRGLARDDGSAFDRSIDARQLEQHPGAAGVRNTATHHDNRIPGIRSCCNAKN